MRASHWPGPPDAACGTSGTEKLSLRRNLASSEQNGVIRGLENLWSGMGKLRKDQKKKKEN